MDTGAPADAAANAAERRPELPDHPLPAAPDLRLLPWAPGGLQPVRSFLGRTATAPATTDPLAERAAEELGAGLFAEAEGEATALAAALAREIADAAYPIGFAVNTVLANGVLGHRPAATFFRSQGRRLAERDAEESRTARRLSRQQTSPRAAGQDDAVTTYNGRRLLALDPRGADHHQRHRAALEAAHAAGDHIAAEEINAAALSAQRAYAALRVALRELQRHIPETPVL